jgi:predicted Zn finger-like uncharacterized protein
MSLQITCPSCRTALRIPDEARGKKVRCRSCQEMFTVPQGASDEMEALPGHDSREMDEQIQDAPRPRRRSIVEEDDDRDRDRPRPRKRNVARPSTSGGAPVALIIGGVIAGLLLVAGGLAAVGWLLWSSPGSGSPGPVAGGPGVDAIVVGGQPIPGGNGGGPAVATRE